MKYEEKINRVFDLAKEIVDIMSSMSLKEIQMFKLEYEIAFKKVELSKLEEDLVEKVDDKNVY